MGGTCADPAAAEQVRRFGPTDLAAVARQFGLKDIRVERPQDLAGALAEAIAGDETCVVDVVTDIDCRAPEPSTVKEA
jgi:acetolactate synthase I/II/III large subunit